MRVILDRGEVLEAPSGLTEGCLRPAFGALDRSIRSAASARAGEPMHHCSMTEPSKPDLPWLTAPWILLMGIVGTTLGLMAGDGVAWAVPLFVVYIVIAVVLASTFVLRRRRSGGL